MSQNMSHSKVLHADTGGEDGNQAIGRQVFSGLVSIQAGVQT